MGGEKEYLNVRIPWEVAVRMRPLAASLDWSDKRFVENALEAILEMARTPPDERVVPGVVRLLDAAKAPAQPLGSAANCGDATGRAEERAMEVARQKAKQIRASSSTSP